MGDFLGADKLLLLFFTVANYSVWVGSLALMGLGIWMIMEPSQFDEVFVEDDIIIIAAIILALGGFLFLTGFIGYCSVSFRKMNSCLFVYITLVLLIVLGELIVLILALLQTEEMELGFMTTPETDIFKKDYMHLRDSSDSSDYNQVEECDGIILQGKNVFLGILIGVLPFEICAIIFSCLMIHANNQRDDF